MLHEFGGEWTDIKLDVMQAYFKAYATALKRKPFERWYVDAFAGTGDRIAHRYRGEDAVGSLFGDEAKAVDKVKDGSVRIALEIEPRFDRYLFIDRSEDHVARLKELRSEYPDRSKLIDVIPGDANEKLVELCSHVDWRRTRAAVFIDPYGMQVSWSTLESLAGTQGVDIALLFPTGSLNRLLKRDGTIPEEWERKIDDHLGPCDWRPAFYATSMRTDLFSTVSSTEKSVDIDGLRAFVTIRLREIFAYVHQEAVPLKNSKGSVLYDLFIICANPHKNAVDLSKKLANGAIKAASKARS